MEYRLRPAGKYMLEAGLEEIHALTRKWSHDLEFHRDEIRFLMRLIGKYAALIIGNEHVAQLKDLEMRLSDAETRLNQLEEKSLRHLGYVEDLMQGVMRISETFFRVEHAHLENQLAYFADEMRAIKKDVFTSSERMVREEALRQLVGEKSPDATH